MIKKTCVLLAMLFGVGSGVFQAKSDCNGLPTESALRAAMIAAAAIPHAGGLFQGERMWGAVVSRDGQLCAATTSTADATQVWPGSQAIAKAKAYTANAFSLDILALSSAMLYTFTQPGHSLSSLGQSNLWNPRLTVAPDGNGPGTEQIGGGLIFFGGGVPLFADGKVVGGLGISGDTACADHEIAKRTRNILGMNPPGGPLADDIVYSPPDPSSVFAHPQCINTWRNGVQLGNEKPESYPPAP
jgi:uncharacterized protein GlcG (DUF336 family)